MISWLLSLLSGTPPEEKPANPAPDPDEDHLGHVMFPDEMCQPRARVVPVISWEDLGISEDEVARCEVWRVKARHVSDHVPDELTPAYVRGEMIEVHKSLERHGYTFEAPASKVLRALRYRFKKIVETGERVKLRIVVVELEVNTLVWRRYRLDASCGVEYTDAVRTVREELKAKR